MALVVRREWSGWAIYERSEERDPSGRRKLLRRTFYTPALEPLPPDEIDDTTEDSPTQTPPALRTIVPYEDLVAIAEGLRFLYTHVTGKRLAYLQRTLQEEEPQEIATHYQVTRQTVQNALQRTRQQVTAWANEVSYAAAD